MNPIIALLIIIALLVVIVINQLVHAFRKTDPQRHRFLRSGGFVFQVVFYDLAFVGSIEHNRNDELLWKIGSGALGGEN